MKLVLKRLMMKLEEGIDEMITKFISMLLPTFMKL